MAGIRLHYPPLAPLDIHAENALGGTQCGISGEPQVLMVPSRGHIFFSHVRQTGRRVGKTPVQVGGVRGLGDRSIMYLTEQGAEKTARKEGPTNSDVTHFTGKSEDGGWHSSLN